MKPYPIDKYKFYITKTKKGQMKTIATSTYAGRTVRGVAICDLDDTYNSETGKKLAAARCALRVAEKRYARANRKAEDAYTASRAAEQLSLEMDEYLFDAGQQLVAAQKSLDELLGQC